MNLKVIHGGARKVEPREDYIQSLADHDGLRRVEVAAGAWVRPRSGNGFTHSVRAIIFYRNFPLEGTKGKARFRFEISHASVIYRCGGSGFDHDLEEVTDPIARQRAGRPVCGRCLNRVVRP